jgi:hypothetical protein
MTDGNHLTPRSWSCVPHSGVRVPVSVSSVIYTLDGVRVQGEPGSVIDVVDGRLHGFERGVRRVVERGAWTVPPDHGASGAPLQALPGAERPPPEPGCDAPHCTLKGHPCATTHLFVKRVTTP